MMTWDVCMAVVAPLHLWMARHHMNHNHLCTDTTLTRYTLIKQGDQSQDISYNYIHQKQKNKTVNN